MMTRIQQLTCCGAVLAALVGCGGGKVVVEDPNALPFVQCKVQMGGKDVEEAIVAFHVAGDKSREIIGNYDSESNCYRFITKDGGTKKGGVPEGEYTVTVKPGPRTKMKIPAKYADPAKSDMKAQVKKGKNFLPTFELTT
jgi:hypothetical protein